MICRKYTDVGRKYILLIVASVCIAALIPFSIGAATYEQDLGEAISFDMNNLDSAELKTLQGLFGLANGTRHAFIGGKLNIKDNTIFAESRTAAVKLTSVPDSEFKNKLDAFLKKCAITKGGRAYLADLIPSIEMNGPAAIRSPPAAPLSGTGA